MAARRHAVLGALFVVLIATLLTARGAFERIASAQRAGGVQAPTFEVDPLWPRPLPNHWVLGQTIGVAVDAQDHVWIVHRGDASLNIMTEGVTTQGPAWTVTSDQPWLSLPGGSRASAPARSSSRSATTRRDSRLPADSPSTSLEPQR
jgi:hypothetical protein